jgi:hypothetical protein
MNDIPNKRLKKILYKEPRYFAVLFKNERMLSGVFTETLYSCSGMRGFYPAVDDMGEAHVDTLDFGALPFLFSSSTYPHI